jgi:hypothetical protein
MTNYRFANGGEEKLTEWMLNNLEYSCVQVNGQNIRDLERRLIRYLEPPLNLLLWRNPQAEAVKRLRKICAEEAANL